MKLCYHDVCLFNTLNKTKETSTNKILSTHVRNNKTFIYNVCTL